ncbi:sulfur carrier protein ThiS [Hyphomicrobium sp. CS1GBMeth3]|uniref:sulfur carrier protein ThiS n=1 Tax=Hyphomicrobium sp. CS1GBMeth3 TaxID=1892845 RepID=UPI00093188F9|nr:sulfur carrier protein ThiS [Hyphomicrobium sp. CS1GBMeth3]
MVTTTTRHREITVNGRCLTSGAETLAALLVEEGFADVKVATAVNGDFVAARARVEVRLADGDRVEILSARQGG